VLSHPLLHPAQFENACASARRAICLYLVACAIALLPCSSAHAQGGVPLVTVATDQTPLNLSNQFGIPAGSAINQAGDFAFVGNGNSALFFRAAGASAPTRLLQIEDEAPGFPDSQIRLFSPLVALNSAKLLLFEVIFTSSDGITHEALLTYDGANYHTVVSSGGIAPPPDSVTYGTLIPGSVDDQGDVNFSAFLIGKSGIIFYIVPSGGMPVRVAATSDTPPTACTWCSLPPSSPSGGVSIARFQLVPPPLNKKGQMLLSLWGGLFIGSKDGLALVPLATSGPCGPITNSVPSVTPAPLQPFGYGGFLNNLGAVSFTNASSSASAICVVQPGGTPNAVIASGIAAPAGIGGGNLTFPVALGMDDSGDIIFQSVVSGSSVTTFALLRYHPNGQPLDVVAYNGEPAPGVDGSTFSFFGLLSWGPGSIVSVPIGSMLSAFDSISVAKDGSASFRAPLSKGGSAIYRQTGANNPEFIFLDGEPAPFFIGPGIRPFGLSPGVQTKILDNGSTFFSAFLTSGAADFAEYVGTPGKLQTLMSTADMLPSGARTILPATPPQAAGHFVAFTAQPAAGRNNLFVSDMTSGTITRVVSDNDPALATAGGAAGDTVLASNFFLNESGQVAFETVDVNAAFGVTIASIGFGTGFVNKVWSTVTTSNCGTIYLSSPPPAAGLTKITAPGDVAPKTTTPFSCVALNAEAPSPLNRSGQLAFSAPSPFPGPFSCPLCGNPPSTTNVNGVFLYTPGATGTISEIAAANDTLPGETQPTTFVPDVPVPVNSAGQVAFGAQIGTPGSGLQGLFVRNAGGTPQKVVSSGDTVPGSTATFSAPTYITGLDDNGNFTFRATTSTATDGIFFAPAGGSIQTIALDGGAAPVSIGGTFALDLPFPTAGLPPGSFFAGAPFFSNIALTNSESDVAFHSVIVGGNTDSGYFRQRRNGGGLQPVVLQGDPVPGGGRFTTIEIPGLAGGDFALGQDGALAFVAGFFSGSGGKRGLFVARPDGSMARILATGDTVPGGGVLNSLALSHGLAAGEAGKFAFWAGIKSGSARQAIFVTALPPGIASTTVTLTSPQSSSVVGQQITLTATVSGTAAGTPSGSVSFFDNGVSLGTGTVSAGQAALNTSSLVAGSHSIVAQYSGDTNFASSNSSAFAVSVTGFAPPPANLTVTAGNKLVIPLTLYAAPGSNFSFMLSCSGLPAYASCEFLSSNPVVPGPPPNGTAIQLIFSTQGSSRLLPAKPRTGPLPMGVLELSAILFALLLAGMIELWRVPRRRLAFSMCLAVFALALVMVGCAATSSNSGSPGTPKGPAAFTVTGTSGATTVTTVVNVTVQ
jgi:hypothetical protein